MILQEMRGISNFWEDECPIRREISLISRESKQIGGQKAGGRDTSQEITAVVQVRHDEDLGQDHGEGLTPTTETRGWTQSYSAKSKVKYPESENKEEL